MQRNYANIEVRKADEGQKYTFIASTYSRDRHKTRLNPNNWQLENFNRNGVIGYQHNVWGDDMCNAPDPDSVVGKGRAYIENESLMVDVEFEPEDINPTAEKIRKKVEFGSLRATSVGFLPIGDGKYGEGAEGPGGERETYYYAGQELLELSIVNIPSNPDAVKKSFRDATSNALMYLKRVLGEQYSFADIENMTVSQVLKAAKGEKLEQQTEEAEKALSKLEIFKKKIHLINLY